MKLTLIETKTIIFDMDETLIHCVDDPDTENPDIIIPIQFPDEDEPVNVSDLPSKLTDASIIGWS